MADEINSMKIRDLFEVNPILSGRTEIEAVATGTGVHGHMYAEEIALSLTPGASNTYTEIGSSLTGGVTNGVTFQNSKELKVDSAGTYFINYSISARMQVGTNTEVHATIMINGTAQSTATSHITSSSSSDVRFVLAGSTILTLSASEKISLAIKDESGTQEFIIEDVNCSIIKLSK